MREFPESECFPEQKCVTEIETKGDVVVPGGAFCQGGRGGPNDDSEKARENQGVPVVVGEYVPKVHTVSCKCNIAAASSWPSVIWIS